ncbi:MAG: YdjY domain-containing protein [Planctomycetota bacterium]|nr:YdjY domain-containing protein [Planctomycetota bacterium]
MKIRTTWAWGLGLALVVASAGWPSLQEPVPAEPSEAASPVAEVHLAQDGNWLSMPVHLEVTGDYLEYLLVNPHGSMHESLLSTQIGAEKLNAMLLVLGLQPGNNAEWKSTIAPDQPTTAGGARNQPARDTYEVIAPSGDAAYLYVAWFEGDERFFYRLEDLIRDLDRGRTMRRHPLVYLGSFMAQGHGGPAFAAAKEGNLINAALMRNGATLVTTGLVECDKQSNWLANSWLLPKRGSQLSLVISKKVLHSAPDELLPLMPQASQEEGD